MTRTLRTPLLGLTLALAMMFAMALPAAAQPPTQEGLVNVNVSEVAVQVPIAVAANICDVNVNVIAEQIRDGGAACDVDADSDAIVEWPRNKGNGGNNGSQEGLVNVNLSNITVQVPVGVAANICDVNANVIAQQYRDGGAVCDAYADALAQQS
jgi:hypothetical protein